MTGPLVDQGYIKSAIYIYYTNNLKASVMSNKNYVRNYDIKKNIYIIFTYSCLGLIKKENSIFSFADAIFLCVTQCVDVNPYHIFGIQLPQQHLSLLAKFSSV